MAWAFEQVEQTALAIGKRYRQAPEIGLLPNEALGGLTACIEGGAVVDGLPLEADAKWLVGRVAGKPVVARRGPPRNPAFVIGVMKALGVRTVVVAGTAWSLNREGREGDLMLVADHINASGDSPLIGPNDDRVGPRFPDMSRPYAEGLMETAEAVARAQGLRLRRGVYLASAGAFPGTPDDARAFRGLGADAYGPGIVPEALAAARAGLETLALAAVAGAHASHPAAIGTMVEAGQRGVPALSFIIEGFIKTSSHCNS